MIWNLKDHMASVHEGNNAYTCTICGVKYGIKRSLKRHFQNVHQEEKFECMICNKMFGYKQSLKDHKITAHGMKGQYQCTFCNRGFPRGDNLKKHITKIHLSKI